jgi:glutamate:GABA antiporter
MSSTPSMSNNTLSVFVLAMLNVSVMASLRNLPMVAEYGFSSIMYFILVAFCFLIPCALISAELSTGWPKTGGIYVWVKEALGERLAFFAIWIQWAHNLSWYPVILTFVATMLAYLIDPSLSNNKYFILSVILCSFWSMTFLNYLGIKTSSWFSAIGVVAGTIIPGIFIITLGFSWVATSHPIQLTFSLESFFPKFTCINNLVFLAGMFLSFAGLEVTAAHAGDVINPQKNYPKAIILASIITFCLFILGSLSIALVIPKTEINLVAGLINAFNKFFSTYHLEWMLPIMAILLIIGAVAEVNAWIIGPTKGLYATTANGNLPHFFQKTNNKNVPTNLLLFQATVVSCIALVFLCMPSISASYWILSALAAQSYLIMYIVMFVSAIKLRYSHAHVHRAYQVPFKTKGMWGLGILGIISSTAAIVIGFIPPAQIKTGSVVFYEAFLISGLLIMCGIPLIIYQYKNPKWNSKNNSTS